MSMREKPDPRRTKRAVIVDRPAAHDVDDELAFHLERRIQDYIARGMSPEAARAAALERFGSVNVVRDECSRLLAEDQRALGRRNWLGDLAQDVRFGVRSATRAPLFTLLAIVTLALGIGANAAVFGVVKSVLLDALPYTDADRLMSVYAQRNDGGGRIALSAAAIGDIRQRVRALSRVGVFSPLKQDVTYSSANGPHPLSGALAGAGFFQTLGVRPFIGRTLADEDAVTGAQRVVVLSYRAWQALFGGDSTAVGRSIDLFGNPHTIVGVLPRDFVGPIGDVDIWRPLDLGPTLRDPVRARRRAWLGLVARLDAAARAEDASRALRGLSKDLAREHPGDGDDLVTLTAAPLRDDLAGDTRRPLLVLMASAGLVLLIMCANLAGALLGRTLTRRRELAVRVALGAGWGRLARQLLTESTLLSLAGGCVGLVLAAIGLRVLRGLALPAIPSYADLSLDVGAVVVTSCVALAAGIAFGLGPALSVRRADPQATLRGESRGATESPRSRRLRGLLVGAQIALCMSLLMGAGLLARSLWAVAHVPLGFNPDGVLTMTLRLPSTRYATLDDRGAFQRQAEAELRALPGVSGVAITTDLPGAMLSRDGFALADAPPAPSDPPRFVITVTVSDDYFRTLGIPLVRGRMFEPTDLPGGVPAVVITQSLARRFWPAGDPIGARVRMGPDPTAPVMQVVGIVGDVRNGPGEAPEPVAYTAMRQSPWGDTFLVRTQGDPLALVKPIQQALLRIDAAMPLYDVRPLRARIDDALSSRRLPAALLSAFGVLALLLASVGVYAMFAAMAASREREFCVRVALGSTRGQIARLVVRQGARWMVAGLAVGCVGMAIVGAALRSTLYGIPPFDPIALAAALVLLIASASAALVVPVFRATRADPIQVLR